MILVVNNQSQWIDLFRELMDRLGVAHEMVKHDAELDIERLRREAGGVVLSGGPGRPDHPDFDLKANHSALDDLDVPVFGICLGHQIIADHFGGKLGEMKEEQDRTELVEVLDRDASIFDGLPHSLALREKHDYCVCLMPEGFILLARSQACGIESMKHGSRPIYSLQSHPEASGPVGDRILSNFLDLCRR